jgi:hypothetical protein
VDADRDGHLRDSGLGEGGELPGPVRNHDHDRHGDGDQRGDQLGRARDDADLPDYVANPITFTATATAGTALLEYRFALYDATTATWTVLQAYSPNRTVTWTPTRAGYGAYWVQVWVRAQGSAASYEAWLNTSIFSVTP